VRGHDQSITGNRRSIEGESEGSRINARRGAKPTSILLASILIVSACGAPAASPSGSTTTGSAAAPGASSEPATSDRTLQFFNAEGTSGLDPATAVTSADYRVMELIYDRLVDYNSKNELVPDLATWDLSTDGLTYTFHVRPEAKFSDGSAVTADDVQFSLERMKASQTAKGDMAVVTSIEVVDPATVTVKLSEPSRILLATLAKSGPAPILSKKALTDPNYFQKPVATSGPYMIQEWIPKDHMTFVANPYYWNAGYPKIKTIKLTFCDDPTSCAAGMESGTADLYTAMAPTDAIRLKDAGKINMIVLYNPGMIAWELDRTKPPFSDLRVRKAVAYMVSRETRTTTCWNGLSKTTHGEMITEGNWAYTPGFDVFDLPPDQALKTAGDLLDQAGWVTDPSGVRVAKGIDGVTDGTKFAFKANYAGGYVQAQCATELLQNDLKPLGIDATPEVLEGASYADKLGKSTTMAGLTFGFANVDQFMDESFTTHGDLNGYCCNLKDQRIDDAIAKARATSNLDEARQYYAQVQQILVDELPLISTGSQGTVFAASPKLQNYYVTDDASVRPLMYATLPE
jgi:peptide/nickel transport system substrate-binding protein